MRATIYLVTLAVSGMVLGRLHPVSFGDAAIIGLLMLLDLIELSTKDRSTKVSNVDQTDAE